MGSNNGREEKEVYRRHSEAWMDGVQGSIYGMSLIWGDQTGCCRAAESRSSSSDFSREMDRLDEH